MCTSPYGGVKGNDTVSTGGGSGGPGVPATPPSTSPTSGGTNNPESAPSGGDACSINPSSAPSGAGALALVALLGLLICAAASNKQTNEPTHG